MGENVYQLVRPGIDEIVNYCKRPAFRRKTGGV